MAPRSAARLRRAVTAAALAVTGAAAAACGDRPGPTLRTADVAPGGAGDAGRGAGAPHADGCVTPGDAPAAPTVWRVQPGDTLVLIAKRVYGTSSMWREIQRANPSLGERTTLRIGETLVMPADVR